MLRSAETAHLCDVKRERKYWTGRHKIAGTPEGGVPATGFGLPNRFGTMMKFPHDIHLEPGEGISATADSDL